jgi:hypothetical protein
MNRNEFTAAGNATEELGRYIMKDREHHRRGRISGESGTLAAAAGVVVGRIKKRPPKLEAAFCC